MSQPQQQPKAVTPQSATANAAIATVCHLVAGGAIVKTWSLLQMETTTKAQNRQLVVLCLVALIAFAAGVTLLHVLITNYKCWVLHAYSVAAWQQAQAVRPDSGNAESEPPKEAATPRKLPKPEPPRETLTSYEPSKPPKSPEPSKPTPPGESAQDPKPKRRRRWSF